jgi:hypothetical protein
MSFKIFLLQLTGKIKPTETIEAKRRQLKRDYAEFIKTEKSDELKDFLALEEIIKSDEFNRKKKEIEGLKFKGSKEEQQLKEFNRLSKSSRIRKYFSIADSSDLTKYEKEKDGEKQAEFKALEKYVKGGELSKDKKAIKCEIYKGSAEEKQWKEYIALDKQIKKSKNTEDNLKDRYEKTKHIISSPDYIDRVAYLKDKSKFEKSEAFKKLQKYKQLASDETIKFIQNFSKSKLYKNYLSVKDSAELKRYYELKGITESNEYKQQKTWLEDTKRWEKTKEFKQLQEYNEQKKNPAFVNYFKYKNSSDFDFIKNWDVVFEDSFSNSSIDSEKWSTLKASAKTIGQNIATSGDVGIFTASGNLKTGNKLSVLAKKEKTQGMIWKQSSGLIPVNFEYTSGLLTSAGNFTFDEGILEAKIKFDPIKQVASSLHLSSDTEMPRINLMEMGYKNILGITTLNNKNKVEITGSDISNLKTGDYIFSLEKSNAEIIWRINETEVFRLEKNNFKDLNLNISSLIIEPLKQSQVNFEINWIKCYHKK